MLIRRPLGPDALGLAGGEPRALPVTPRSHPSSQPHAVHSPRRARPCGCLCPPSPGPALGSPSRAPGFSSLPTAGPPGCRLQPAFLPGTSRWQGRGCFQSHEEHSRRPQPTATPLGLLLKETPTTDPPSPSPLAPVPVSWHRLSAENSPRPSLWHPKCPIQPRAPGVPGRRKTRVSQLDPPRRHCQCPLSQGPWLTPWKDPALWGPLVCGVGGNRSVCPRRPSAVHPALCLGAGLQSARPPGHRGASRAQGLAGASVNRLSRRISWRPAACGGSFSPPMMPTGQVLGRTCPEKYSH